MFDQQVSEWVMLWYIVIEAAHSGDHPSSGDRGLSVGFGNENDQMVRRDSDNIDSASVQHRQIRALSGTRPARTSPYRMYA